jgi:hypothetical protein
MGGIAAAAIIGAGSAYYGAKQQNKNRRQTPKYNQMLPPELEAIFNPKYRGPKEFDTPLGRAVTAWLSQAGTGLPDNVLQRGQASIASGFRGALDQSNRNAAFGFGPAMLSGAQTETSRARASANFGADFAAKSQEARMAAMAPLMNFFSQIQGIRYGVPTDSFVNPYGAAASGAGAGISAYNAYKTPSDPRSSSYTTGSAGTYNHGAPTTQTIVQPKW